MSKQRRQKKHLIPFKVGESTTRMRFQLAQLSLRPKPLRRVLVFSLRLAKTSSVIILGKMMWVLLRFSCICTSLICHQLVRAQPEESSEHAAPTRDKQGLGPTPRVTGRGTGGYGYGSRSGYPRPWQPAQFFAKSVRICCDFS